jgi:hypothetical protein
VCRWHGCTSECVDGTAVLLCLQHLQVKLVARRLPSLTGTHGCCGRWVSVLTLSCAQRLGRTAVLVACFDSTTDTNVTFNTIPYHTDHHIFANPHEVHARQHLSLTRCLFCSTTSGPTQQLHKQQRHKAASYSTQASGQHVRKPLPSTSQLLQILTESLKTT